MEHSSSRGVRVMAGIVAAVLAMVTPLVAASSAVASVGYTGTTTGDPWDDSTLDPMTEGVAYASSLSAPSTNGPWDISANNLPAGLNWNIAGNTLTIYGTPSVGGTVGDFGFTGSGGDGASTTITFSGVYIEPSAPPAAATTTTIAAETAALYTNVELVSTVAGASPTGTVTFTLDGHFFGTGVLSNGVATFSGPVSSTDSGLFLTAVATYGGDENNAPSTSDNAYVYIFVSSTFSGSVYRNGSPYSTTVQLVKYPALELVAETTSTGGAYSFTIPSIDTVPEASAGYYVRVRYEGDSIYYRSDGGPGVESYSPSPYGVIMPTTFGPGVDIYIGIRFIWSDTTLATPQQGTAYSDYVAAGAGSATKHYTVTTGTLPPGLTLSELTGEIHGTPTDQVSHTFTVTVTNGYSTSTHEFTLQPTAPGVAPTFTEVAIAALTVGTAVVDGVTAVGDPTIVYSVSSGTLPTGLELNTTTGAITGTPTAAGEFTFTLHAANAYGHDEEHYTVVVAAVPTIDLELQFGAGTRVGDAETEISAEGLKVGSEYTLDMHSAPVRLYTGLVDATGGFTWLVSIPADTPVGAHELILTGIAPDNSVMTAHAWFTLLPNGTIGAISYLGPLALALAASGVQPLLPFGAAGVLMLLGYLTLRRSRAIRVP